MTSSIHVLIKVALLTFIPLCSCRTRFYDNDDDVTYVPESESPKHVYLPIEIPYEALFNALRQPTHNFEKRGNSGSEILAPFMPKMDEGTELKGMKRKMFWQPLGYLPASVRAHNNPVGSSGTDTQGSSSNVFRYG
jgi:hypothetical protein